MFRTVFAVFVVVGAAMTPEVAEGQWSAPSAVDTADGAPLVTTNRTLHASLQRIASRSALWREAVDTIRGAGRHVFVLTPDQVKVADELHDERTDAFDPTVLAEAAPGPDENSHVRVVLVVVNLALIEEIHRDKSRLPGELDADLDRILIHEIYGHAFPYLLAGNMSGRCADPKPHERASDACSIRRENAVREQLGLGRRMGYGLEGLALARSWYRRAVTPVPGSPSS